jgi:hypothetical protein
LTIHLTQQQEQQLIKPSLEEFSFSIGKSNQDTSQKKVVGSAKSGDLDGQVEHRATVQQSASSDDHEDMISSSTVLSHQQPGALTNQPNSPSSSTNCATLHVSSPTSTDESAITVNDQSATSLSSMNEVDDSTKRTFVNRLREKAKVLYLAKDYRSSILSYTDAIKVHTTDGTSGRDNFLAVLLFNRAAGLAMVGAYGAAVSDCEQALQCVSDSGNELSPDSGPALRAKLFACMGKSLLKLGETDKADAAFQNALQVAETTLNDEILDPQNLFSQVMTEATLGKTEAARLRDTLDKFESSAKKCLCFRRLERRSSVEALNHVDTALATAYGSEEIHKKKVKFLTALKRWREVTSHCEQLAAELVKLEGVFTEDLAIWQPTLASPTALTLGPAFFGGTHDEVAILSTIYDDYEVKDDDDEMSSSHPVLLPALLQKQSNPAFDHNDADEDNNTIIDSSKEQKGDEKSVFPGQAMSTATATTASTTATRSISTNSTAWTHPDSSDYPHQHDKNETSPSSPYSKLPPPPSLTFDYNKAHYYSTKTAYFVQKRQGDKAFVIPEQVIPKTTIAAKVWTDSPLHPHHDLESTVVQVNNNSTNTLDHNNRNLLTESNDTSVQEPVQLHHVFNASEAEVTTPLTVSTLEEHGDEDDGHFAEYGNVPGCFPHPISGHHNQRLDQHQEILLQQSQQQFREERLQREQLQKQVEQLQQQLLAYQEQLEQLKSQGHAKKIATAATSDPSPVAPAAATAADTVHNSTSYDTAVSLTNLTLGHEVNTSPNQVNTNSSLSNQLADQVKEEIEVNHDVKETVEETQDEEEEKEEFQDAKEEIEDSQDVKEALGETHGVEEEMDETQDVKEELKDTPTQEELEKIQDCNTAESNELLLKSTVPEKELLMPLQPYFNPSLETALLPMSLSSSMMKKTQFALLSRLQQLYKMESESTDGTQSFEELEGLVLENLNALSEQMHSYDQREKQQQQQEKPKKAGATSYNDDLIGSPLFQESHDGNHDMQVDGILQQLAAAQQENEPKDDYSFPDSRMAQALKELCDSSNDYQLAAMEEARATARREAWEEAMKVLGQPSSSPSRPPQTPLPPSTQPSPSGGVRDDDE